MKLSDYLADFLAAAGIEHVFGITGGAVMHMFHSFDRHPNIKPIFTHHEQAAALAAEAYARVRNGLGAALVTTGPAGTNAITGLCAAWLDSIPCLYLSGQARVGLTTKDKGVRQVAPQAIDIVRVVTPLTKYAVMVDDAKRIRYELEKAVYLATTPRSGPVWLDIPLDLQWAEIEPEELPRFDPREVSLPAAGKNLTSQVRECVELLRRAERPILLAGSGIRLGHAEAEFVALIKTLRAPFLSSWNASDLLPTDHPLYVGRPGMFGQRGANLAIQNCDLLLSIGSHLAVGLTTPMFQAFAREAKRVVVDVDQAELTHRTVRVDLGIRADAKVFLQELLRQLEGRSIDVQAWRSRCTAYKKYNDVPKEWWHQQDHVNPYVFLDGLSEKLGAEDVIVVDGGGTITEIGPQAVRVKQGQRFLISAGLCTMGTLPETIGACFGSGRRRTIFLCGDGSLQLNIQELQTIVHHQLPIKMFILNNDGYLLMRVSQKDFFESNFAGSSVQGGLSIPDSLKIADAYGLQSVRIRHHEEMMDKIQWVLDQKGPVLCDLMVSPTQEINPRLGFDLKPDGTPIPRPMEDMAPFLDRQEFLSNMVVKPWEGVSR